MLKIRKGNPLTIIWAIKRDNQPVRLADFNIKVELSTSTGIICINEFNVDGNILSFTYAGNSQRYLGKYTLTLIANDGTPDMFVVDACNVFELVARSCQSGGEGDCSDVNIETLKLSSDILVGDSIQLADPMAVHYDREDGRSLEEQARARKNIGVDTLPLTLQYSFPGEVGEEEESIILVEGDNSKIKEYLLSLSDDEIKAQDIRAVVDNGESYIHLTPTMILAQKQEDNRIIHIYFEVTSEFDFGYQLISVITNIPEGDISYLAPVYLFDEEGKLPADRLPKSAVQVTPQDFTAEEQKQARENIGAQQSLTLTVKDNGNIVIGNLAGQTAEFMPATPSGDPNHYLYEMAGATYNATSADITKTGYYGDTYIHKAGHWDLNEVGDMTNEDMRYTLYRTGAAITANSYIETYNEDLKLRTNIWNAKDNVFSATGTAINCAEVFFNALNLETAYWYPARISQIYYMFASTSSSFFNKLKKIFGVLSMKNVTNTNNMFCMCGNLQYFRMSELNVNLDIHWTSVVSLCSLQYLVDNATNTSAITITVHADVYAKLTDETNTEWYALYTYAQSKNIAFATA